MKLEGLNLEESADGAVKEPLAHGDPAAALLAMMEMLMPLANRALEARRQLGPEEREAIRHLPESVLWGLFSAMSYGYRAVWREIARGRR